jgi:hypothetical protein
LLGIDIRQGATIVKQLKERPPTTSAGLDQSGKGGEPRLAQLALWQLNLLRVGYFVMGVGLAVVKWPLFFDHEQWGLAEGTKECLLAALSVLALLGLRYPRRMVPILLFEVAWKLLWLGAVALPLWLDNSLEGATRQQTGDVLWVVIIIAVIPWRHVFARYIRTAGDPWRRRG